MVSEYILKNWENTIRDTSHKGHGMVALPKPFSTPSIEPLFEDFYYWDTYFINLGLLVDGFIEQAKNNLDNIAYFIRHMGYMPNASHLHYTSQPPLFTRAVYVFSACTKDKNVLKDYFDAILQEYNFFMNDRMTEIGLNQYGCANFLKSQIKDLYGYFSKRVGVEKETEEEQINFIKDMFAICESGWDCSPRFDTLTQPFVAHKFTQVDLNCLLYDMENIISEIYDFLGERENSVKFKMLAEERKRCMNAYMLNRENGLYYDYNFVDKCFSKVVSDVSFYPYLFGVSSDVEGLKELLKRLELPHGISACEYEEKSKYLQWDYPMMWAPNVYFAYEALVKNGLETDAKRIAIKYRETVERNYTKTGILWEKYNAKTGEVGTAKDSTAHPMLGWTAAVYQYLGKKLNDTVIDKE